MWAIGGVDGNKKSTSTVERSIDDFNFIELLIASAGVICRPLIASGSLDKECNIGGPQIMHVWQELVMRAQVIFSRHCTV